MAVTNYEKYFGSAKSKLTGKLRLKQAREGVKATAIIVGLNEWEKYTKPLVQSILDTNPQLNVICVDNGSLAPYEQVDGAKVIRTEKNLGLAGGMNFGKKHAPESDWYIFMNNDVLFHKSIAEEMPFLDPNVIYGFYIRPETKEQFTWAYMSCWCIFISKEVWDKVGEWDENCFPMYWEDADYSKRALDAGFRLGLENRVEWGIVHLMDEKKLDRINFFDRHYARVVELRDYIRAKHAG